jgi:hypothetical protein
MYSKTSFVVFAAAVVLLAGASVALAHFDDDRDYGLNAHQTELDQEYGHTHPTITPGTPVRNGSSYGYVSPHRPKAKHLTPRIH